MSKRTRNLAWFYIFCLTLLLELEQIASDDSIIHWSPTSLPQDEYEVSMSESGQYMVAVSLSGTSFYYSLNFGLKWRPSFGNIGENHWIGVASSSSGQVVAAYYSGWSQVMYSIDYGAYFTRATANTFNYNGIGVTTDGSIYFAYACNDLAPTQRAGIAAIPIDLHKMGKTIWSPAEMNLCRDGKISVDRGDRLYFYHDKMLNYMSFDQEILGKQ